MCTPKRAFLKTAWLLLGALGSSLIPNLSYLRAETSLFERTSYNSQKQTSVFIAGSFGLSKNAFLVGNLGYTKTPYVGYGVTDTTYTASSGISVANEQIGIELLYNFSASPLVELISHGGSAAATLVISPSTFRDNEKVSRLIIRSQSYENYSQEMPYAWVRLGGSFGYLKSGLYEQTGQMTSATLDAYTPRLSKALGQDITVGAGLAMYFYNDSDGFFSVTRRTASNLTEALLGSTVQGLPSIGVSTMAIWQIAELDSFLPRYTATLISYTDIWAHTASMGWKHRFSKHLFVAPNYDLTFYDDLTVSGISLDFTYLF